MFNEKKNTQKNWCGRLRRKRVDIMDLCWIKHRQMVKVYVIYFS